MKPRFTVDTHIFRELGQYLVGRDSTALAELVKNTYDADATEVTVYGEALDDLERGMIRIVDNGNGMTAEEFSAGFLRIASRVKEAGERRSARFGRRFTGAKGIGRLAAQKLADRMEVESVAHRASRAASRTSLVATINWDLIEQHETLDEIKGTDKGPDPDEKEETEALRVVERAVSQKGDSGTTITLRKLRQTWSGETMRAFAAELDAFRPSPFLVKALPDDVVGNKEHREKLLFVKPKVSDSEEDPGYVVKFDGDFARGEELYPSIARVATWILDIDATVKGIRYVMTPTARTLEKTPFAERYEFSTKHPAPKVGPFFQARILERGRAASRKEGAFFSGVRIYMEGFRVLPYGDDTDDWLRLKQDSTDRTRTLALDDGFSLEPQHNEGLLLLPSKHYAGGVFLTQRRAPGLEMVINREGFVAGASFSNLADVVRRGVHLLTRVRASVVVEDKRRKKRKKEREERPDEKDAGGGELPDVDAQYRRDAVESSLSDLHEAVTSLRAIAARVPRDDVQSVRKLADDVEKAERLSRTFIEESAFTRVLASLGLQLAAFVHELNSLLNMANTLEQSVLAVRETADAQGKTKTELARLHASVTDLRMALERQATYLVDIASSDARRRRSKQPIAQRLASAEKLVRLGAERARITVENKVPEDLRTPAMYASELIAVFSNLLTNAVKAAGEEGRIRATASARPDGTVRVRVENTGVAVKLEEAERWFRPLQSTTTDVDLVLGQGMGLGLTITRDILDEYRAKIRFVAPSSNFATAIEILFPAP